MFSLVSSMSVVVNSSENSPTRRAGSTQYPVTGSTTTGFVMPSDSTRPLARHLIAAVLRHGSGAGPPDRELLAKFAASRDEDAFAELVRRHGSMVLAVARRVTGHIQDAEDAFQAAFLVLARRAGQITRPELLGNWLYGVAYRTALEARAARRRVKEQQGVAELPERSGGSSGRLPSPGSPDSDDLRRVIDEELALLPEKYRTAVVLCDLEGLSRRDAAGRLKIPEGTLSSRLNHARKLLAGRLTRRGVTTSAGAVAAAFSGDAAGTMVPSQLVLHTARAAGLFASGGAVPPAFASTQVTTLTDGVIKAMIVNRLRLTTGAVVLALGLMGIGAAAVIGQNPPPPRDTTTIPRTDDLFGTGQPPAREKKPPEKIAAKGIEDDDVPYPSFPAQAIVRLEEGKIIVRQRSRGYTVNPPPLPAERGNPPAERGNPPAERGPAPGMQSTTTVTGQKYDSADVSVFDMKGNRVATKAWKEKLKEDQHALVAFDGRLPHPRELTLFKDDVLLIVFPGLGGDPGAAPAGYRLRQYYEPVFPRSIGDNVPQPGGNDIPPLPATIPPATTLPLPPRPGGGGER